MSRRNSTFGSAAFAFAFAFATAIGAAANAQPANDPLSPAPAPAPALPPAEAEAQVAPAPAPDPAPVSREEPIPTAAAPAPKYEAPIARDRVVAYYTGLQLGISPGIILPTRGGDIGFLLSLYGGYGIEAGSIVVIPGAHATGAWPPNVFIGTFTPTVKLVFPLGAFAPYIEGGAGPGYVSVGKRLGAALRVGGGFSVHPSPRFAIGAGAYYETITGTDVSFIGPVLILSF